MPSDTSSCDCSAGQRIRRCWHLSLAYDGTAFCGWQIQPKVRTVQGELADRLRRLFSDPDLRVAGTSRTDAGVHALDQQASFEADTPADFTAEKLHTILNRWLPSDIVVTRVQEASLDHNVRFAAAGKAYTYVVNPGDRLLPMFAPFAWHFPRRLDLDAMREAARHLVGELDFSSFAANPKREVESHVRLVHRVEVLPVDGLLCINVVGESFLYKMVRSMVGWLAHVGRGAAPSESTLEVLAARDRSAAADSAPAEGLFLAKVFFGPDEWRSYEPILPPFRWRAERQAP
jgi:tRNA pseudouridine38-40 synthase